MLKIISKRVHNKPELVTSPDEQKVDSSENDSDTDSDSSSSSSPSSSSTSSDDEEIRKAIFIYCEKKLTNKQIHILY